MLVIAANASFVAPIIKLTDPLVWKVAALVVVLFFIAFALMKLFITLAKYRFPKDVALIYSGGLRNCSAVMVIAVTFFPEAAVLPALTGIIVQQTIAAIIGKVLLKQVTDNK